MSSFLSQPGHVGFKTQSVRGTYADPGAVAPSNGLFMKTTGGSMGVDRELLMPDPEIGGTRDYSSAELSEVQYTGQYTFYARMDSLATLLRGVLGSSTSTVTGAGTTQVGTHVIGSATQLPWLSMEEQIGNGFDYFRYTDAKVDSLKLSIALKGYFTGTVSLAAITQLAGITPTALNLQTWDYTPQIVSPAITVAYNGVNLPALSLDVEFKNNLDTTDNRLGQFVVGDITEKKREITISVKTRPSDRNLWRQSTYGNSAATSPAGSPTPGPIVITAQTWEFIGTTLVPYSLSINVPVGIIKPFKVSPAKDDIIEESFDIMAFRPNNNVDVVTCTVINDLAVLA